jgi:hypothetical protein
MACTNNHANIAPGGFCPLCGARAEAPVSFMPTLPPTQPMNTEENEHHDYYVEKSSSSKAPKVIALASIIVSLILVIAGIVANKSGYDGVMNQVASDVNTDLNNSTSGTTSSGDSSGDTSWVPSGYTDWNSAIAYQVDTTDSCQTDGGNGCWIILVTPNTYCSSVSGTMDLKDSNGNIVNSVDASAGSVTSGHYQQLEFDDPDGSAAKGVITSLTCD